MSDLTKCECEYVLEANEIVKRYGTVVANNRVDFRLRRGEVHCLLGENGAGKSTLVKILYGLVQPDSGQLFLNGKAVHLKNSADAINHGIGMVHQELMLIPYMTVAENVTLGCEISKFGGRLDMKRAIKELRELSIAYGLEVDPAALVCKLPIGLQQRVEIIKLLFRQADVLILDEPTALLTPQEADELFEIIGELKKNGKSIIFITHKLNEVYQIADRMTVMRGGQVVGTTTPEETTQEELSVMMVGKNVNRPDREGREIDRKVMLKLDAVTVSQNKGIRELDSISFEVHAGEILGVAGIEGNGQSQLASAIFGEIDIAEGHIICDGEDISNRNIRDNRNAGMGFVPEDRQKMGLILPMKISENLIINTFSDPPYTVNPLFLDWKKVKTYAKDVVQKFDVRTPSEEIPAAALSGGNQQKVVVGRELSVPLKFLIAAQPTRGVDIASASFIHQSLLSAAQSGTAVLLISSDLDELMAVSDRIMVLQKGRNVGIVDGPTATKEELGKMMLGVVS